MTKNKMAGIKRHQLEKHVKLVKEVIDANVRELTGSDESNPVYKSQAHNCVISAQMLSEYLQKNGFKKAKLVAGIASFGVNTGDMGIIDFGYTVKRDSGFDGHCWVSVPECDCIVDLTLMDLEQNLIASNRAMGITEPKDQEFHLTNKVIVDLKELKTHDQLLDGACGYNFLKQSPKMEEIQVKLAYLNTMLPTEFSEIRAKLGI